MLEAFGKHNHSLDCACGHCQTISVLYAKTRRQASREAATEIRNLQLFCCCSCWRLARCFSRARWGLHDWMLGETGPPCPVWVTCPPEQTHEVHAAAQDHRLRNVRCGADLHRAWPPPNATEGSRPFRHGSASRRGAMRRTRSRLFRVHSDSSVACFSAPPRHLARVCHELLLPSLIFGWEGGARSGGPAPNLVQVMPTPR